MDLIQKSRWVEIGGVPPGSLFMMPSDPSPTIWLRVQWKARDGTTGLAVVDVGPHDAGRGPQFSYDDVLRDPSVLVLDEALVDASLAPSNLDLRTPQYGDLCLAQDGYLLVGRRDHYPITVNLLTGTTSQVPDRAFRFRTWRLVYRLSDNTFETLLAHDQVRPDHA